MASWRRLDEQMAVRSARLVLETGISRDDSHKLATIIASEIRILPTDSKREIASTSPVPLVDRLDELQAFQGWMDFAASVTTSPLIVRAQVITQNYICFVYLPESCFRIVAKSARGGSCTKKTAKYLCNGRIRSLRNAIAHANWCYRSDFKAIKYWARTESDPTGPLSNFEVDQEELSFWQSLSRCVAYTALSNL
jgi:hypothetical protein